MKFIEFSLKTTWSKKWTFDNYSDSKCCIYFLWVFSLKTWKLKKAKKRPHTLQKSFIEASEKGVQIFLLQNSEPCWRRNFIPKCLKESSQLKLRKEYLLIINKILAMSIFERCGPFFYKTQKLWFWHWLFSQSIKNILNMDEPIGWIF